MIEKVTAAISSRGFQYTCEDELQQAIASVLTDCSIPFDRESRMTKSDRPDFRLGDIALEVKVDGSRSEVMRQLHRYAQIPEVSVVILVTDKNRHRGMPRTMNGKDVHVIYLNPL